MFRFLAKGALSRQMKPLVAAVAAGGIALAGIGVAVAAPADPASQKHGYFGTVSAKGDGSLTIERKQGEPLALAVTSDTAFRTAGDTEVTLQTIEPGSRVAVLAQGEGSSQTALKVMVIPERPPIEHRVVAVTEVSGKTAKGQDMKGQAVEVELDEDSGADLKGHIVTFVAVRSERKADAASTAKVKARARVKLEEVVDRLEGHAAKMQAEAKTETRAEARKAKAESIAQVKARIEAHIERHQQLFAELIARAPESAKPHLEQALEVSVAGMSNALVALGESRADVDARVELRTVIGQVTAVDAATSTVKVKARDGAELELKVNAETEIKIGGKAGVIADLKAGDRAMVRYNPETKIAARIHVQTETKAEGSVSSVDVVAGTLSIKTKDGAVITVNVNADTEFDVDGLVGGLAGLVAGTGVEVEYDAGTMTATEVSTEDHVGEPQKTGQISAVAVGTLASDMGASNQLAVNLEGGGTLMLTVDADTEIEFNGEAKNAADLRAGDRVRVRYDAQTRVAEAIDIRGRVSGSASSSTNGPAATSETSGSSASSNASASGSASTSAGAGGMEAKGEGNVDVKITLP